MAKQLTTYDMDKVWKLHKKGLEPLEIAETLDISKASARRIIKAFEAAIVGDHEALEDRNITDAIRQYAKERFGVVDANPQETAEEVIHAPDNTAKFLVAVLDELSRNNALLEKLCKVWGVE